MVNKGFTKEQLENFDKFWKQISERVTIADVSGPVKLGPPKEEDTPRYKPILWPIPPENLLKDLEKYRQLALNLGAVEAKIIPASEIPQDLRSLYVGCLNPSCRWLNTNSNCPMVKNFPFEEMVEYVRKSYKYALAYKVLPPKFDGVPDAGPVKLDRYYIAGGGDPPDQTMLVRNIIRLRILGEIERRLRAVAYYDGYMLAAPMSTGPCLVAKCADIRDCPALEKGGLCRFLDVQPTGSGVAYIDYFTLSRKLGFGELQVGGNCAFPENVPNPNGYFNIGLMLIE